MMSTIQWASFLFRHGSHLDEQLEDTMGNVWLKQYHKLITPGTAINSLWVAISYEFSLMSASMFTMRLSDEICARKLEGLTFGPKSKNQTIAPVLSCP